MAAVAVWLVIWRVKFSIMENVTGLLGLTLIVFAVALFLLKPDWGSLASQAMAPPSRREETGATYWYFAIALFGAAMTPYEVFFFSSGAVEEGWKIKDLIQSRINVLVGFPLGGLLSVAIAGCAAVVLLPAGIAVTSLSQVILPVAEGAGKLGLAVRPCGHRGRDVRRRAGDHAVQRLHPGAVLRLVLGQVPPPGAGRPLPPVHDHLPAGRARRSWPPAWTPCWSPNTPWCSPRSRCR